MRHARSGWTSAIAPLAMAIAAALSACPAAAQAPAAPPAGSDPAPGQEPASQPAVGSLTARYLLQEKFTTRDNSREDKDAPLAVGQYQAGILETVTVDGAGRKPRTTQIIFTERPAQISSSEERLVTDLVRHYSTVKITPDPFDGRAVRSPLDDLTVWFRRGSSDALPQVMVLTPDRPLSEEAYAFSNKYDFVTNFAFLLPDSPKRVAEPYVINRQGAIALVNHDDILTNNLGGKIVEIRAHPQSPDKQLAILSVTGKLTTGNRNLSRVIGVNARVQFAFRPAPQADGVIDAQGAIEKISLSESATMKLAESTQVQGEKRQLVFERKIPGPEPLIAIPSPAPEPTRANSWLSFTDKGNRFHLKHPQDFQPGFPREDPNMVIFAREHTDTQADLISVRFVSRPDMRPEVFFQRTVAEWRAEQLEVAGGIPERLPAADWPNMVVHHMEAVLTQDAAPGQPGARRYVDNFILQYPRNVNVFVESTTFQDDPTPFRKQVRELLKTVALDGGQGK